MTDRLSQEEINAILSATEDDYAPDQEAPITDGEILNALETLRNDADDLRERILERERRREKGRALAEAANREDQGLRETVQKLQEELATYRGPMDALLRRVSRLEKTRRQCGECGPATKPS